MWASTDPSGPAFGLRYQQVVMHAISRDPTAFTKPCIYLQLDEGSERMGDEDGEGEDEVSAELRLVPADEAKGIQALPPRPGLSQCKQPWQTDR